MQEVNIILKQYITCSGHPSQSRILNILGSYWKPAFAGSFESFGGFMAIISLKMKDALSLHLNSLTDETG